MGFINKEKVLRGVGKAVLTGVEIDCVIFSEPV